MKFQLIVILFLMLMCYNSFAQDDDKPSLRTYYMVVYDEKPDSVYLDGKSIPFENEHIYEVDPGVYEVMAVKKCYKPLKFNSRIRENHQKLIRLDFERLSTPQSDSYRFLTYKDYAFTVVGVGTGFLISSNFINALPVSLMGLLEHFIWKQKISNHIDNCTAAYSGKDFEKSNIRLSGGISSSPSMETEVSGNRKFSRLFQTNVPIRVRYFTEETFKIFPTSNFLATYAFSGGIESELFSNLSAKISASYYPFITVEYHAKYHDQEVSSENSHSLIVLDLELNLPLVRTLDQEFSLSFGGFVSNKIEGTFDLPLLPPQIMTSLRDSTAMVVQADYGYQVIGGMIGIRSDYYISDNLSLYYQYLMNFGYQFDAIGNSNKSLYYSVKAGASWGL